MSLIVVHLRWDDVSRAQYELACRALPSGDRLPDGCFSRTLQLRGRVLHGTEAWAEQALAERSIADLPDTLASAGLAAPMTVVFALPDAFAAPYRQALARRPAAEAAEPPVAVQAVIPAPRAADHDDTVATAEQVPGRR
jgi:hypothetical protein